MSGGPASVALDPIVEHGPSAEFGPLDAWPRSELVVAADTLWALAASGAIDSRQWTPATAAEFLGIDADALEQARRRWIARGRQPLPPDSRATSEMRGLPRPPDPATTTDRLGRAARPTNGELAGRPGEKRCPRCGEWKTLATDFDRRGPNERRPRAWCRDCYRDYQAERYLSVAETKRGDVAATFILDAHDDCVGTPCSVCRLPLGEGDLAAVVGDPVHEECREAVG